MKDLMMEVKENVLQLLDKELKKQLPRRIVEQKLSTQYNNEEIGAAISSLLNDFVINLVIEYPPKDIGLNTGRPCWFLKLLSEAERKELHDLSPLKLSLLRILQQTSDEDFPGVLPTQIVTSQLIGEGYSADDVKWLSIKGRITRVKMTSDEGMIPYYMIIPEYEKTEEHKKFLEEAALQSTEKELREMKFDEESRRSIGEKSDE